MTDMGSFLAASGKRVTSSTEGVAPLGVNATNKAKDDDAALRQAAEAFEAVFLRQMIGSMRSASLGEDLLGNDASEQFRDMADARLADSMAEQQSFGIAELLLKQFGQSPSQTVSADGLSFGDADAGDKQ
ncbi:rod-binding protein [Parasphingorhabdus sp. SCSIO 66989]|uniref:Rod-binding protein n=2 Tax=Alterisphingorhabdus coralli TaxID=3071408 RepID=A0AA97F6B3_9SPHN|nr:rod-binding protein [Parasphingorhabdus sp. SCSIO 66989]WOE74746.1 rod-binding protein [Parasphingorhabdus sp. SCSIO 66989]